MREMTMCEIANTSWRQILLMLFFASSVGLIFLAGCGPKYRYYYKGNVELTAVIERGLATYGNVIIGTPEQPFYTNLNEYGDIKIELQGETRVSLKNLTVPMLKAASTKSKNLDDLGYDTGWPKGSKRLTLGTRFFFTVNGDKILQFYTNVVGLRRDESPPVFILTDISDGSKRASEKRYLMPLSHEEVLELFGKPDKLNDVWHK